MDLLKPGKYRQNSLTLVVICPDYKAYMEVREYTG